MRSRLGANGCFTKAFGRRVGAKLSPLMAQQPFWSLNIRSMSSKVSANTIPDAAALFRADMNAPRSADGGSRWPTSTFIFQQAPLNALSVRRPGELSAERNERRRRVGTV